LAVPSRHRVQQASADAPEDGRSTATRTGINGGPQFPFAPATSLLTEVEHQAELDRYREALTAGDQEVQCGSLPKQLDLAVLRAAADGVA
jgi:hypothetical protein